jgi:hypothetical protein
VRLPCGISRALLASLASCVDMPDPPPLPEDLSQLAAQYDHPTAELPLERVQHLIDEGRRRAELGETLNRLQFVRTAISDTSAGLGQNTNWNDLLLQGSITASAPCPGDGPKPTTDGAANGVLYLTFGIENSRLRRGFEGAALACRVLASAPPVPDQRVMVSATITGDLGADIGLGNTLPHAVLMRLGNVTGRAVSTVGTVELAGNGYHFRLTQGNALEVLFDPASFGLPDLGSVVFAAWADGSFALRERRGEWVCGGGGEPCALR